MPELSVASLVLVVVVAAFTAAAAVWDIRERRIPNKLTLPVFFAGWIYQAVFHGWSGLGDAGLGFLVGFGVLFALWMVGGGGGGDVKLMGALSVWARLPAHTARHDRQYLHRAGGDRRRRRVECDDARRQRITEEVPGDRQADGQGQASPDRVRRREAGTTRDGLCRPRRRVDLAGHDLETSHPSIGLPRGPCPSSELHHRADSHDGHGPSVLL